jgi:hypothetical protein
MMMILSVSYSGSWSEKHVFKWPPTGADAVSIRPTALQDCALVTSYSCLAKPSLFCSGQISARKSLANSLGLDLPVASARSHRRLIRSGESRPVAVPHVAEIIV